HRHQPRLLSQGARKIPKDASESLDAFGKRPPARLQNTLIQPRRKVDESPVKRIQFNDRIREVTLRRSGSRLDIGQTSGGLIVKRCGGHRPAQLLDGTSNIALQLLQVQNSLGEAVEPSRSQKGFTREAEQAV